MIDNLISDKKTNLGKFWVLFYKLWIFYFLWIYLEFLWNFNEFYSIYFELKWIKVYFLSSADMVERK